MGVGWPTGSRREPRGAPARCYRSCVRRSRRLAASATCPCTRRTRPAAARPPVSRAQSLTCAAGRLGRARAARCIAAAAHRTARRDRAPRCDARVALRSAQPERRAFPPVLCRLHPPVPSALVQACATWPTVTQLSTPPRIISQRHHTKAAVVEHSCHRPRHPSLRASGKSG